MEACAADMEESAEFAAPKLPVAAPNPVGRGKGARHQVVAPERCT